MTMTDEARLDVPRNDLIRGLSPLRAEDDGNVMVGYPIVFNQWTEINSWEGHFLERVLPSGPKKAIKEGRQKVQYNHGMHPVVGTSGLGKPSVIRADDFGVYSEVPLSQTSYNRDIIKPQLADGTLDGMSFRFSVIDDRWHMPKEPAEHNPKMLPERSLVEFKWPEFGPVDWPAYEAAMAGIRSQAAFAMWLQTPTEQRMELMRQFDISAPREPRVWVPGWEPKITPPTAERAPDPPADPEVTGATGAADAAPDDSGPVVDTTRSTDADGTPPEAPTYQPARPPVLTPERRESQKGLLRTWLASVESRSTT